MTLEPGAPRPGGGRYPVGLAAVAVLFAACFLGAGSGPSREGTVPSTISESAVEAPLPWADLDCDGEQDPVLLILDRNGPALAEAGEIRSRLPRSWAEDEDDSVSRSDGGSEHVRRCARHLGASRARGPRRSRDVVPRGGATGAETAPVSLPDPRTWDRVLVSTTRRPGDPRGPPAPPSIGATPMQGRRALGGVR